MPDMEKTHRKSSSKQKRSNPSNHKPRRSKTIKTHSEHPKNNVDRNSQAITTLQSETPEASYTDQAPIAVLPQDDPTILDREAIDMDVYDTADMQRVSYDMGDDGALSMHSFNDNKSMVTIVDDTAPTDAQYQFGERKEKLLFIRNMYLVFLAQTLLMAVALSYIVHNSYPIMKNVRTMYALIGFVIAQMVFWFLLGKRVMNITYLVCVAFSLYSVSLGMLLGLMSMKYGSDYQYYVIAMLIAFSSSLASFAHLPTGYGYSAKEGVFLCVTTMSIITGLIQYFGSVKVAPLAFSAFFAIAYGIFMVVDTEFMLIGTHHLNILPHNFVYAAFSLYLDVFLIFIYPYKYYRDIYAPYGTVC